MIFKPQLAEAVMAGRKTVTRRPVSVNTASPYHPNRVGSARSVAVQPGRGEKAIGRARIVRISIGDFYPALIPEAEARREGFEDGADFKATWQEIYGDLRAVRVWRIELEAEV